MPRNRRRSARDNAGHGALPPLFAGARRVLFFHAHPDDESLWTGGLIARLTDVGVTVRVITCTRGERGEVVPGPLAWLEGHDELAEHRVGELTRALHELGAGKPCLLGGVHAREYYRGPGFRYVDSGMAWGADGRAIEAPDSPESRFFRNGWALRDGLAAAKRFAPDLIVGYDRTGGYGHPDHRWAHVVAKAAADRRGVPFIEVIDGDTPDSETFDPETSDPEAFVGAAPVADAANAATRVPIDLARKRRALAAHASQLTLTDDGYVLSGGQHHLLEPIERYRLSPPDAARAPFTAPRATPAT